MVQLPNSIQRLTGPQKIFAYALIAAAGFGVLKGFNHFVLPELDYLLSPKHMLWTFPCAAISAYAIFYVVTNPRIVWGFFKTLSWKLTAWLIKQDPLSTMDRYVDYLKIKRSQLIKAIQVLTGKKIKLDRTMSELQDHVNENLRLGAAAIKTKGSSSPEASMYGVKVRTDNSTLQMFQPQKLRVDNALAFMNSLDENWKFSIEKLEYQIEGKRREYEIIKETAKGLRSTEAFLNSDNESARAYGIALKALEEEVTQSAGYISNFMDRSKDIMSAITIEKQAIKDEGLAELEKYMQNGKLLMPDFSKIGGVTDLEYETVPAQASTGGKFNLLGK